MNKRIIGIDFGTSNTLIWINNSDAVIFNEPTILAWNSSKEKVEEIGYLAHKLIGKSPKDLTLINPVVNGGVADIEASVAYFHQAFTNLKAAKYLKNSSIIFSAPSNLTKVQKTALERVGQLMGAKEIFIEDSAKLSAIGSGIDVFSTRGNMIVDIGGASTDIAATALGQIVVTHTTNFAGNSVNEAIVRFIRTSHHLIIGVKTAEYIKMKIGTLLENPDNNLLEISGKNVVTGLPHSIVISTEEIKDVVLKIYKEISNVIIDALELCPPEISSDIIHTGITLSGGGCLLNGTREFFQRELSVPIHISPYPLGSAIQGIISSANSIVI